MKKKNNFSQIKKFLKTFNIKSFNNRRNIQRYTDYFKLEKLIEKKKFDLISSNLKPELITVTKGNKRPFEPDLPDLCRLHWIVLSRKIINVLEFGSGFSTIFMAHAQNILKREFNFIDGLRYEKQFHTYSVEESSRYAKITNLRSPKNLKKFFSIKVCKAKIVEYKNHYASKYINIPNISPDLIYLDAPSQYFTKKTYDGFSFSKICRMPMSADILYFEYFLEPGTVIVVDGRTANARFLKENFKRNWKYLHDEVGDCHYFELNEKPLGKYNKKKLDFCLENIKFI